MEQVVFGGRMNIPKGTTFFKTGENVEHVYLLVNGQVRCLLYTSDAADEL